MLLLPSGLAIMILAKAIFGIIPFLNVGRRAGEQCRQGSGQLCENGAYAIRQPF